MSAIGKEVFITMAAIAIYKQRGVIDALRFLQIDGGLSALEAIDFVAMYDQMEDHVSMGPFKH